MNDTTIDIFSSKAAADSFHSLSPDYLYIHPITIIDN
jgi:hypothetical protein